MLNAGDFEIYTSAENIATIQRNLSEDINNLCHWLEENELIINLKKGKTETILFGTSKRINLQGNELNISVKGTCINNTFSYKYLGVDLDPDLSLTSYFDKTYKRAAGRVNLLRSIRPSIDQNCAETIYKFMIRLSSRGVIFTRVRVSLALLSLRKNGGLLVVYDSTNFHILHITWSWSDTRKSLIKNIEQRSLRIWRLKLSSVKNTIKLKSGKLVFQCLQDNVCSPFKSYFERLYHSKSTRNNGFSEKLPKVRLEFGEMGFYYQGAKIFNELPVGVRSLTSRILFKKALKAHFS